MFNKDGYSNTQVKHLIGQSLPPSIELAVEKRKAEFVAGRYLARLALTALSAKTTSVGIGNNRCPIWPASFVGSISHNDEFAICMVAASKKFTRIGIDIEEIAEQKVAEDIHRFILVGSEYQFISSSESPDPRVLTLIFSAKESLFKALYPEVGYYFDFNAAQIKEIDYQTARFTIELLQKLSPNLPKTTLFSGRFEFDNNRVITMIFC